jgi:hypothetical protein
MGSLVLPQAEARVSNSLAADTEFRNGRL